MVPQYESIGADVPTVGTALKSYNPHLVSGDVRMVIEYDLTL